MSAMRTERARSGRVGPPPPFEPKLITIDTPRGRIEAQLFRAVDARAGVVLAGGIGSDWDSPAKDLYPRLGRTLAEQGITVVWLKYRDPTDLDEATADVSAVIDWLAAKGIRRIGLVGHSFGGAVMITAGAKSPHVVTVVALAPQSFGTEDVPALAPRSLLLLHGTADGVLPPSCSISIYDRARPPRELELLEGCGHVMDEESDRVFQKVRDWLVRELSAVAA